MTDSKELKERGLKVTTARIQILEIFQAPGIRHLTADDVYRQLIRQGSEIGLATVYRVLTQLQQAGLLKQVYFESGRALYELDDGEHHDHLICTDCGRVQEFHDKAIEQRQKAIAQERGFQILEHSHVLYGRCLTPECEYRPEPMMTRRKRED